jgi:hypothetical protein
MTERCFADLRRAACLLAVGLLVLAGPVLAAGNFPSAFVVSAVPVDATAQDAVAAREAAQAQGQRTAFRRLLERLTSKTDWPRLPQSSPAEIAGLVQDFEVSNERSSGVRYIGNYTFRFSPNGVRRLLRSAGITINELASKPVVLVPVLRMGQSVKLWDDQNPWRAAWAGTPGAGGLVPWVVPTGDATDAATLDAAGALAPKPDQLAKLSARYGGGDVVVATAVATEGGSAAIQITVSRYSPDGTPDNATAQVTGPKLDSTLYLSGVDAATHELEESWKKLTTQSSSSSSSGGDSGAGVGAGGGEQDGLIEVVVPIRSAHDWAEVRERLSKVPVVHGTDLELMTRREVRLRIKIRADDNLLHVALAQQDLTLTPGKPYDILQLRGGAP